MSHELAILTGTAATIGIVHTLLGPDHYLPFIVLSSANQWSRLKTTVITAICGVGHVLSSVVLGFIGIALGTAVFKLEALESFRGELAAWLLIIFGFTYFVWGMHQSIRGRTHRHLHPHQNGKSCSHAPPHMEGDTAIHLPTSQHLTPWILFTIFVFGPCEPLIPLVMYPAARGSMMNVVIVAFVFGVATIGTMLGVVLAGTYGLSKLPVHRMEKYSHAIAGFTIFLCGGAIKFLGL